VYIDITPLVTGNSTYSIIIKQDPGGNDVKFGSRESTRRPRLSVETEGSGAAMYGLTVNNGAGSGSYLAGTIVNIVAEKAPAGRQFDRWSGDTAYVADVNAVSTVVTMPDADVTVAATYKFDGGIGGIGPIHGMSATGHAGLITAINGIPVSDLRLGTTAFPTSPASSAYPADHADDFDLNSVGSADGQPYFECTFDQGVMTIFLIENGGNDSGFMQALDPEGNLVGDIVRFTTDDYLKTDYESGIGQAAGGLAVWTTVPVFGIRVTPPTGGVMGFDPISISASTRPRLEMRWDSTGGGWQLVWFGDNAVLQQTANPELGWSDVSPLASSPHALLPNETFQWFRLREGSLPHQ
jgi:hypothetical protein